MVKKAESNNFPSPDRNCARFGARRSNDQTETEIRDDLSLPGRLKMKNENEMKLEKIKNETEEKKYLKKNQKS